MKIPLSNVDLSDVERTYAAEALASGWISGTGGYVEKAEKSLAAFCDTDGCTVVCNGTAALHLALMCMGVEPGDEVIVPGMTFVSPAAVVARMGAVPVIADVQEVSWCLDPGEVDRLATERTRGVIAVDLLGHPADFDALREVCRARGLFLVEDAAEAHGSRYKGRRTGSLGDVSTLSFFANKTLTCGEGGALLSRDMEVMSRAVVMKNHGMTKERPYWHDIVGDNFRLSNLQAAILLGQIERAEEIIEKKMRVSELYRQGLSDIESLALRPSAEWADIVPWIEPIQILPDSGVSRDELVARLRAEDIDVRALWAPLARLPAYRRYCLDKEISTPVAERLLDGLLWLPTSSVMTETHVEIVVDAIRGILHR